MNELARAIQTELSAACAHLLDEGLAPPRQSPSSSGATGPLAHILQTSSALWGLLQNALQDLEHVASGSSEEIIATRIPRRAIPSRRPYDYSKHGTTIVPVVWESTQPVTEPARDPLAWLLYGLILLDGEISRHLSILGGALDEAIRFREGSTFGREDVEQLDLRARELGIARDRSGRMRTQVSALANWKLRPSQHLPHPFPQTSVWRIIRGLIRGLEEPGSVLPSIARSLFVDEPRGADVPFLYQRWCGWKIVSAMTALGFVTRTDPIPALLLSGSIEFQREDEVVHLLCDPRLVQNKAPIGGLSVRSGEATPDLVLTAEGPLGLIAFVLDPTLCTDQETRRVKGKYLDILTLRSTRTVAGVRILAGPERSWAAAPLSGSTCTVGDWRGAHGTIPMNPCAYDEGPLRAWINDLLEAVRAARVS